MLTGSESDRERATRPPSSEAHRRRCDAYRSKRRGNEASKEEEKKMKTWREAETAPRKEEVEKGKTWCRWRAGRARGGGGDEGGGSVVLHNGRRS